MARFSVVIGVAVLRIAPYIRVRVGRLLLVDYYCFPEHLVTMALAGDLSFDSGYFRFGMLDCLSGRGGARWRQRSGMTLVHDSEPWCIKGAGGGRARIAWAEVHAEQLIYRIEPASPSDTGASGT